MGEILHNIVYMARRFKLATVFNMLGLTVAFAAFYLLMTQVIYQVTFNHSVEDYGRIYRMESSFLYDDWEFSDCVCRPFADVLARMPQVESYSLVRDIHGGENFSFPFVKGDSLLYYTFTRGNATAVSALTGHVLDGSIEWTAGDQEGIIIPASIAREYFGTTRAAGKEMLFHYIDEQGKPQVFPLAVRGVFEDFADNCEMWNCIYGNIGDADVMTFQGVYKCHIKFKSVPRDLEAFGKEVARAVLDDINDSISRSGGATDLEDLKRDIHKTRFKFTPLDGSYFEHSSFTTGDKGYRGMLVILALACLLVIVLATINFLNFTLAESPVRIRSLNTRLVLGAGRQQLRRGVVWECVITAVAACLLALAACGLLSTLPPSRLPLTGSIALDDQWPLALITLGLAVGVGAVAGVYPAIFATSFPPALVLKGAFGLTPRGRRLRSVLVFVQLFVSMLMVSYIGILISQNHYIYTSAYGYDKDRILCTTLPDGIDSVTVEDIRQELLLQPGIESLSLSDNLLGATDGHNMIKAASQGRIMSYCFVHCDQQYMSTMGIDIVEGRDFAPGDTLAVIINRAARHGWPWLQLGDKISTSPEALPTDSAAIVGVCDDIRYGTTRINNDKPFVFILDNPYPGYRMSVRIAHGSDAQHMSALIDNVMRKHCDGQNIQQATPYDKMLQQTYHNEFRFFRQVSLISVICLVITLIGVFCITMFETEYRRKEIGIRKVAGATSGEILWMLCRHYGWMTLISFALAVPVAVYCGRLTLDYFAQRTPIHWWIFPLSLLIVGTIMLGTVALQGWRTARENPTASIKTE